MKKLIFLLISLSAICSCSSDKGGQTETGTTSSGEAVWDGASFGVVNLSVCNMRRAADYSSEMITQAILGTPVRVLKKGDWYYIQTPDDYRGWVNTPAVSFMNKTEYNAWNAASKVIVTAHYGFTYAAPDVTSRSLSDVVAGSRLRYEGMAGDFFKISYPNGKMGYIHKDIAKREEEWRANLKQDAESVLNTARSLLGIPYLWAGTSSKGVDCSGYVRTVLYMHDIIIPRDAYQQAAAADRINIAADFSNLQPGDLIYFGRKPTADTRERVIHVAFYLGDKTFIHSQGDVRINSFDPADPLYDEYNLNRLLFANRILDRINATPELSTTTTNLYYLPQ